MQNAAVIGCRDSPEQTRLNELETDPNRVVAECAATTDLRNDSLS